jgi:hypothetical protein
MRAQVINASALLLLTASRAAFGDMAVPGPTPAGAGGASFEVHDIHRGLTPFGWALIVLSITVVIILIGRGLLSFCKRRRGL